MTGCNFRTVDSCTATICEYGNEIRTHWYYECWDLNSGKKLSSEYRGYTTSCGC